MHNNNTLLVNKKAKYDYVIEEEFISGMVLSGKIVNFIRQKKINLAGKYIVFQSGRLQLIGLSADKMEFNIDLLLSKKEIFKIKGAIEAKGISCIPLEIFRVKRWMKLKIAIVKGRNKASKKDYLIEKDIKKEIRKGLL